MGASWVEVDRLIREVTGLCEFPHAEALGAVVRARDVVAEAAMAVALAALSGDALSEVEGQDLLARARVAVRDADLAVLRAQETAALYGAGHERAQRLMAEARALCAKDCATAIPWGLEASSPKVVGAPSVQEVVTQNHPKE